MDQVSRLVILVVAVAFATADVITFKDCGSVTGTVNQVDMTPCPSEPCQLKKGDNATMKVEFTPKVNSTKYSSVLHGIIGGIPVPFPLPNGITSGPIISNNKIVYSNFLMVLPSYPKVSLVAKLEIQDDNGKDLVCFVWPIQIVD